MAHTIPPGYLKTSSPILRTFEDNYRLLMKLFKPLFNGESEMVLDAGDKRAPVIIEVRERHKYMTILDLRLQLCESDNIPDIMIGIRLYFDARVAEVISYQGVDHIPARYQIKLSRGDVRDEKMQVNLLLNEFLNHIIDKNYRPLDASTLS
ncbi:MAG: DUF1249 domain-containing protein [Gammaproteobacteria bacterium]|nr:DUF1249 domain-containing protein [Gammaproteobacteria bacterium]